MAVSEPPLYDFFFDLVVDPPCDDLTCDCCSWFEGKGFRFSRAALDAHAHRWAASEKLDWSQRAALFLGIYNLPWEGDEIIFYWGDYEYEDDAGE